MMKTLRILLVAVPIALALSTASSAVSAPLSTMTILTAHLKGSNEVGTAGAPRGRGVAIVKISVVKVGASVKSQLCYKLTVAGFRLSANAAHIHAGRAGTNGPIALPFPRAPGRNGTSSGCTNARLPLLRAIVRHPASYYVNIHTRSYPLGAVRGQLGM